MNIIDEVEKDYEREGIPDFAPGDTVRFILRLKKVKKRGFRFSRGMSLLGSMPDSGKPLL